MKNTKIVYDSIIYSLQSVGGISNYWTELIKRITKIHKTINYEKKNKNIFRKEINISQLNESGIPTKILRFLPFQKKLPARSIFHSSYYRTTFQKDVVKIITIYDFIHEYKKNIFLRTLIRWQINLSIKNADGIICISNSTKNDLFKFLPNINKQKVKTIYISITNHFYKIKDLKNEISDIEFNFLIDKKIILYVGSRKKTYKNFSLTLDIVEALKECVLVSVGPDEISNKERAEINRKIKGRFYHLTKLSSNKLNKLYNLSFCLIYPSTYEGFGIPVLEAMKAGCPVVSTNMSSIPEVVENAAILVKQIKKENFIEAIKLLDDHNFRSNLINKGKAQAEKFSWNKCFEETNKFYHDIYNKKFN
tara:strand:+ start:8905 stop:9996 length:1092 start_codon:yes stop_codon:yes gene_type:complete